MIRLHYKKGTLQRIILVTIGFAVIAICVAVALAYLLPNKPNLKDGDIVIGDTTITKKQINDYANNLENYKKSNPGIILDGESLSIASDDLIMNAALKFYAKKYEQTVTNRDVLLEIGVETKSNEEADSIIESRLGDSLSISRIRNENVAYQKKLADYLLAIKSVFIVKVNFDMSYFKELPQDQVQSAYDDAQKKLKDDFIPLFKSKLSKEDIAKKADVNFFDEDRTDDADSEQYARGAVVGAALYDNYRADGQYFNNLETTDYIRGDVGKLFNMDDKIATLKNVGDYTDVFTSKTGVFSIIRLEAKSEGKFNSWQEMLESFKREYAYDIPHLVMSDVSYGSQVFVDKSLKTILDPVSDNAYAVVECYPSHRITFHVRSYNNVTKFRIAGSTTSIRGRGWCGAADSVTWRTYSYTTATGSDTFPQTYDCDGTGVWYARTGDPSGYSHYRTQSPYSNLSVTSGDYVSAANNLGQEYANGNGGFPKWVSSGMNELGNVYINHLYNPSNVWTPTPTISVNKTTAKPGDTITWAHSVSNAGPDATTIGVDYYYVSSNGFTPATVKVGTLASGSAVGVSSSANSTHTVNQDNVGKTLCRRTRAIPASGGGTGSVDSVDACVPVPYNYALTPSVGLDNSKAIESDTEFTVTPTVSNIGPTKSQTTAWQLTKVIISPGNAKPGEWENVSLNSQQPCGTYFDRPSMDCSTVSSGNTVFSSTGSWLSGDNLNVQTINSEDYDVGTKICFALSVKPHSSSDSNWAYSRVECLTVGVRPKLQVWGGDLVVGGNSITSTSRKRIDGVSRTFGSWVEYGIFAKGVITGTASGSAFAGPGLTINNPNNTCGYSKLSFSLPEGEEKCKTNLIIGNYDTGRSLPDISASLQGTTSAIGNDGPVVTDSLVSDAGGTYIGSRDGDLRLNSSTLSPGKSVILKVTGTVYINGDQYYKQNYNGSGYTSIKQLPQLVIIANKIVINRDVTNVDAWLVATNVDGNGTLETCDTIGNTINTCNKPLLVNGPVIANKISFRRTGGSGQGAASGDPAEIFNLRPDSYLWAISRTSGLGRIQTVNITELPPRL